MVSKIRPVGSAAVRAPVEAVLTSWKTSSAVGGPFREDGFSLFGVRLGTVLLSAPFGAKNACDSPLRLFTTDGREWERWGHATLRTHVRVRVHACTRAPALFLGGRRRNGPPGREGTAPASAAGDQGTGCAPASLSP